MAFISEEIQEENKLIAVFMGAEIIDPIGHGKRDTKFPVITDGLYVHKASDLKYHTSWDWLMPVIEKITKLGFRIKTNFNKIENSVIIQHMTDSDQCMSFMYYSKPIDAVYVAVAQFIKWYNTQIK